MKKINVIIIIFMIGFSIGALFSTFFASLKIEEIQKENISERNQYISLYSL